ncbi:MAG: helix-turn-helix domain-containing protein [Mycoplasmatota bacterium]
MVLINNYKLTSSSLFVYGLIYSLSSNETGCYASNKYLSSHLKMTTRTISRSISELKYNDLITVNYVNKKRILRIKR